MEQGAATQSPSQAPQDWRDQAVEPVVGWFYLVFNLGLFATRLWQASLVLGVAAAVLAYNERRKYGLPAVWWTIAILIFGPLAFLFFAYKRSRPAVAYPPSAPPSDAAVG
jgi:hypothetical protein